MSLIGAYILFHKSSGHFYVGSSIDIDKRIARHIRELMSHKHHNVNLQTKWNTNPVLIEFVYPTKNREDAYFLEKIIIENNINNNKLLNIGTSVKGGDNLSRNPNRDFIIAKMTNKLNETIGNYTPLERKLIYGKNGDRNGMWGRTHTPEVRKKLSDIMKSRIPRKGFKLSDTQKKILSECAKKRIGDKNHFFGKKHTEETKNKLRQHMLNNPIVPSNVRKISIDSEIYPSLTEAARKLNVSPALIVYRLKNPNKYPTYAYIDLTPNDYRNHSIQRKGVE